MKRTQSISLTISLTIIYLLVLALAGCTGPSNGTGATTQGQQSETTPITAGADETAVSVPAVDAGATQTADVEGSSPPAPQVPVTSHGGPVKDYVSLIDNLRASGVTVEPAGEVSQPYFSVSGFLIKVNDSDVQVFEYADAAAADVDASKVAPDLKTVGTTIIEWVGPPHLYKQEKVIVLYVGDDLSVIKALEEALGPQFAGR